MSEILATLLNNQCDTFAYFDQVFLFGSSLWNNAPNDIDILLIYDSSNLDQVNAEKDRIEEILMSKLPDATIDFTTLQKSELRQTAFLTKVPHRKLKG